MKRNNAEVTFENLKRIHAERQDAIRVRLGEFASIRESGSDARLWEEMVFCFFTGGCSARMGINSIEAVRPLLLSGSQPELAAALVGKHRYPNARSRYVVESRAFLKADCGLRLRERLESFDCPTERRDWLAREKGIKGLGYKEASHYLRNIGYRGYAILDKHVLRCMLELGVIDEDKPPSTRSRYLATEQKLFDMARRIGIDPDELDLVLWSLKTGVILK